MNAKYARAHRREKEREREMEKIYKNDND